MQALSVWDCTGCLLLLYSNVEAQSHRLVTATAALLQAGWHQHWAIHLQEGFA